MIGTLVEWVQAVLDTVLDAVPGFPRLLVLFAHVSLRLIPSQGVALLPIKAPPIARPETLSPSPGSTSVQRSLSLSTAKLALTFGMMTFCDKTA